MSVKSKHSVSKKDKNNKKEKKKKLEDSDAEIESSEEELDLTKECHPIGYYINDRAEMINQMFSVIRGNKLKAMLPPILKDYDVDQLKLQCLDQLLGMSEKRITCILEGGTLDTSSESEVAESDEYDSNEKNGTSSEFGSDRSDYSNGNRYIGDPKHKKRKTGSLSDGKGAKAAKGNDDNVPAEQGKTLLEILELEMRARAIRALLKQSGTEKGNEQENNETNTNGVKEIDDEVVDLTECKDDDFPVCVKKEKTEESDIDERVSTFEKKIEKSKAEKTPLAKDEKSKRLQAELELRNKLFKKKIYRTRQQRMESEEEDKINETKPIESSSLPQTEIINADVVVKKEPIEPDEVVVEDPEEGEISTSEDEYPVVIKQEVLEPGETEEPQNQEESEPNVDFGPKTDENVEKVTAIDNGTFVYNCNLENRMDVDNDVVEIERSEECLGLNEESQCTDQENKEKSSDEQSSKVVDNGETESRVEETSWRDRWLKKDGVQKLVKSSKIYAKVKKRIAEKSQKAKEEVSTHSDTVNTSNSVVSQVEVIEGSIKEYERLLGKVQEETKETNITTIQN